MVGHKISKELAEIIKQQIWQEYNESDLDVDMAEAIKFACSVVDSFVGINSKEES